MFELVENFHYCTSRLRSKNNMSFFGSKTETAADTEETGKIKAALEEVRPMLARHLGDIEFVDFKKGTVYVRLLGTCVGCPMSQITLKAGVEELLKERVPGIDTVVAV